MKKDIPYRAQLLELSKLYRIKEIRSYLQSKKHLTTSQIELILLKNKIPLPAHTYNKKKIAEIRYKEQVVTNVVLTIALLGFITSLMTIRPYIKLVTSEVKFTHIAKEYKSNFKLNNKSVDTSNNKKKFEKVVPSYLYLGFKILSRQTLVYQFQSTKCLKKYMD